MRHTGGMRFAMRYSWSSRVLFGVMGMGPRASAVEVADGHLRVRMGWAFAADIPVAQVRSAVQRTRPVLDCGVHGWRGRWNVNGVFTGLVEIHIEPAVQAHVLRFPVRLRELRIGVDDPTTLIALLTPRPSSPAAPAATHH